MALSWRLSPQRILEFEFSFEELGDLSLSHGLSIRTLNENPREGPFLC